VQSFIALHGIVFLEFGCLGSRRAMIWEAYILKLPVRFRSPAERA
jgi:hypothetical protein